jgi:hypothetical protein
VLAEAAKLSADRANSGFFRSADLSFALALFAALTRIAKKRSPS